jgi:hypothetical protein
MKKVKRFDNGYADYRQFQNDQGAFVTTALFYEPSKYSKNLSDIGPFYSMYSIPEPGYESAKEIYLNAVDEYDAAMKIFGSLKLWNRVTKMSWFADPKSPLTYEGLNAWREEKRLRDLSRTRVLLEEASDNGDISATKKLYDEAKKRSIESQVTTKKGARGKKTASNSKVIEMHERLKGL